MTARARTLIAAAVAAVLTAVLGFSFLARTEFFNPFDENSHYDYVVRIASELKLPPRDAQLSQQALADWSCSEVLGFEQLTCGAPAQDSAKAPWGGVNTATRYFPAYYALTAIPTRLIHDAAGTSWLDAARIATSLWLIGLAFALVLLARQLGMRIPESLATAVLVCSMPMVVVQGVSMNNDIAATTAVVLSVWSWLALRSRGTWPRLLVSGLLALAAMTMKENAIVALLALALLETAYRYGQQASARPVRERLLGSLRQPALLVGGVIAGYVFLLYLLDPLVRGPASTAAEELVAAAVAGIEPQDWGTATAKAYGFLVNSLQTSIYIPVFNGGWAQLLPVLVLVVIAGGLAYRLLRTSWPWRSSPTDIVCQSSSAYLAGFPLLFFVLLNVSGLPLVFQPRYYLPGLILGGCVLLVGVGRRWAVAALVGSLFVYTFMLVQVYTV